jgi:signal transduction histidine kinase
VSSRRTLSIRARLVIAYAAVAAVVLGTSFAVLQWRLHVAVRSVVDEDLLDDARAMGGFVDRGDVAGFAAGEATMRAARGTTNAADFFLLRDAAGHVAAGFAPGEVRFDAGAARALAPGEAQFANVRIPGQAGRFRRVILAREPRPGERWYVEALRSQATTDRLLARFGEGLLAAAVLGSAVAAAGGLLLAQLAFRPFAALIADAAAIAADPLARRLRDPGTGDELAALTAVLNESLDRVAAGVASVRRFVHDASHELRTPLASLRLGSEALLRAELPVEARELAEGNLEEIERLARLVDDLLVLARAEGEGPAPSPSRVDAAELLGFVAERVRPLAEAAAVALEVAAPPPGAALVAGDRDALVRLLWNLLDNAVKYTPAGGRVRLAAARAADKVRIAVEDTGAGVAPEDLPRLGERFFRGTRGREGGGPPGTGLGLAIARAIARRHGGGLDVESEVGRGTRVIVTLPEAPAAAG